MKTQNMVAWHRAVEKANKDILFTCVSYVELATGINLEREEDFKDLGNAILGHLVKMQDSLT